MAQGLSERLKDLNEDVQMRYSQRVEEEKKDIRDCLEEIKETNLYKSLPIEAKHIIDNMFEKKYRYIFQEDNSLKSISFEDAYKYLNFDEKSFYGSYSFFSLHGHPSYLTLIQFRDAFVGEERADLLMAKTAAHYVLSFMSIFILDFMKIDEEMKGIFDSLEKSKREFICFFEKLFRNKNK